MKIRLTLPTLPRQTIIQIVREESPGASIFKSMYYQGEV